MNKIDSLNIDIEKEHMVLKSVVRQIGSTTEDFNSYIYSYLTEYNINPTFSKLTIEKISIPAYINPRSNVNYEFIRNETTKKFEMVVWGTNDIHNKLNAKDYKLFNVINNAINEEWSKHLDRGSSDFINGLIELYDRFKKLNIQKKTVSERLRKLTLSRRTEEFEIWYNNLKNGDKIIFKEPMTMSVSLNRHGDIFVLSDFTVWKFSEKTTQLRLHYITGKIPKHFELALNRMTYLRPNDNFRRVKNVVLKRELLEKFLEYKLDMETMAKQHQLVSLYNKI